jgi:regulator of replication initiation timing
MDQRDRSRMQNMTDLIDHLREENARLRSENARLRGQVAELSTGNDPELEFCERCPRPLQQTTMAQITGLCDACRSGKNGGAQ